MKCTFCCHLDSYHACMHCRVHSSAQAQLSETESSDVYSFGVFLLELVTGREAAGLMPPGSSKDSLAQWVSI